MTFAPSPRANVLVSTRSAIPACKSTTTSTSVLIGLSAVLIVLALESVMPVSIGFNAKRSVDRIDKSSFGEVLQKRISFLFPTEVSPRIKYEPISTTTISAPVTSATTTTTTTTTTGVLRQQAWFKRRLRKNRRQPRHRQVQRIQRMKHPCMPIVPS